MEQQNKDKHKNDQSFRSYAYLEELVQIFIKVVSLFYSLEHS